jgi:hypothetical protein
VNFDISKSVANIRYDFGALGTFQSFNTNYDDLDVIEDATEEGENRKSKRPKTWVGRVWRKITFKDRREAKKERPKKEEVVEEWTSSLKLTLK